MSDGSPFASPGEIGAMLVQRSAAGVAALLAAAAFAGILPGATVFLGLLSADPLLTLTRLLGAVCLADALRRTDLALARTRLRTVGVVSGGIGVAAFVDPHLAGALPHGIQVPEAALALTLSAFCLAVASVRQPRSTCAGFGQGPRERSAPCLALPS